MILFAVKWDLAWVLVWWRGTIVSPNGTGCASVAFASAGLLFWSGTNGNWREAQPSLLRCASSGLLFLISFWWLVGCDERTENVRGGV